VIRYKQRCLLSPVLIIITLEAGACSVRH
jgi:hypothetical protein